MKFSNFEYWKLLKTILVFYYNIMNQPPITVGLLYVERVDG